MADPVLHLLVGPNGSGKSTLYEHVIAPVIPVELVNADVIARERWPEEPEANSYKAAELADARRKELLARRTSFVAETVFSHPSKLDLVTDAKASGFLVTLHVVMIPLDLTFYRVAARVHAGGHDVDPTKIRERYARLWGHAATAIRQVGEAIVYDNSVADRPFRVVARFADGMPLERISWPMWAPAELRELTSS